MYVKIELPKISPAAHESSGVLSRTAEMLASTTYRGTVPKQKDEHRRDPLQFKACYIFSCDNSTGFQTTKLLQAPPVLSNFAGEV